MTIRSFIATVLKCMQYRQIQERIDTNKKHKTAWPQKPTRYAAIRATLSII